MDWTNDKGDNDIKRLKEEFIFSMICETITWDSNLLK